MLLTANELHQAEKVKERAAKAARNTFEGRHIDEVSDADLNAMSLNEVARLDGAQVAHNTLSLRVSSGMTIRQAATMPPQKPRYQKPTKEHKRKWNNMSL